MLTLGTCKFLIGPSRVEYVVHRSAFTDLSPMLGAMMSTAEATGACVLDDVEECIFASLCEFAYTGDYFMPKYQADTSPEEEHHPNPARDGPQTLEIHGKDAKSTCFEDQRMSAHRFCDYSPTVCPFCGCENCKADHCHKYVAFEHVVCDYVEDMWGYLKDSEMAAFFTSDPLIKENDDTAQVLLHHAKLHVLGDRFKVDALRAISINRIHKILTRFPVV
ncbi:hypothetical protein PG997_001398 [Apiospora hydei]|uniref:BTB domain-containing protein n=1 Tax=Apiospora hydei TaxID=1337664 RepID=A0ABR1XDN8_9PEZI